ncbi:hypothetical protein MSM1_14540 [Mycobacterium sp. SM1]|uniref:hypothetical protein n=1 Tax=Mycobacterium sp. SM1 TaxID=2816243 RepID=UPI001BCB0911|nr:hypothetical protein [Mycobacterium sp. SM1]MBS4729510.1 hypothetical protein [Mycobacterium sp. SM1]
MWCPSVSLSVWANAWLAGKAAPDDVLDALSRWAPTQSVTAYDAVAAGHTGLPWPDVDDAGAVSLLQTLRTAAGRSALSAPSISVVLPVPGDVRGLAAGTQFERDALSAGEAVIVSDPADPTVAVGLVPEFGGAGADHGTDIPELRALSWTVYSLPGAPVLDQQGLGEAEYELRSAVRSAADTLSALGLTRPDDRADPRTLVTQLLESSRQHRIPDHAPSRAVRVLENAAHVEAIIAVSSGLTSAPGLTVTAGCAPIRTLSSWQAQITGEALRPLVAVVRSARMAAVSAILRSAWQG